MDAKSNPTEGQLQHNELLTVKEVADYLRVGRVTVWRWCKEGTLPAYRVGRNWRIPRDDFLELLNASYSFETNPIISSILKDDHKGQVLSASADDEEMAKSTQHEEKASNNELRGQEL